MLQPFWHPQSVRFRQPTSRSPWAELYLVITRNALHKIKPRLATTKFKELVLLAEHEWRLIARVKHHHMVLGQTGVMEVISNSAIQAAFRDINKFKKSF